MNGEEPPAKDEKIDSKMLDEKEANILKRHTQYEALSLKERSRSAVIP